MQTKNTVFKIQIYRPNTHYPPEAHHKDFALPATPEELLDMLHQTGLDTSSDKNDYTLTVMSPDDGIGCGYVNEHINRQRDHISLEQVNFLAQRLAEMDTAIEAVYEGLVQMRKDTTIPIDYLIALTNAAEDNPMAYNVVTPAELGRMSFDDDYFPELLYIKDDDVKFLNFARLGRDRQEAEGGVFTKRGYVPNVV